MATRALISSVDVENQNPNIAVAPSPAKSPRRKNFLKKQQYRAKAVTIASVTATPSKDYEFSTSVSSVVETPKVNADIFANEFAPSISEDNYEARQRRTDDEQTAAELSAAAAKAAKDREDRENFATKRIFSESAKNLPPIAPTQNALIHQILYSEPSEVIQSPAMAPIPRVRAFDRGLSAHETLLSPPVEPTYEISINTPMKDTTLKTAHIVAKKTATVPKSRGCQICTVM